MGQSSSQDSCCTSRSAAKKDDDPKRGAEVQQRATRNDGGFCTGSREYHNEKPAREGGDPLCNVSCVNSARSDGGASEKAPDIFGEKALRPKLLQLHGMEEEVELLEKISAQAAEKAAGAALPPEDVALGPHPGDQWAKFILQGDAALKGTPVALVVEACANVLGAGGKVAELTRIRSSSVKMDVEALLDRLSDIEDLIIKCFEKIDENNEDFISKRQFVVALCDPATVGRAASPKDAANLFNLMTQDETDVTEEGEKKLTFERFKEEITEGCLQMLAKNLDGNSKEVKKYRDWMM